MLAIAVPVEPYREDVLKVKVWRNGEGENVFSQEVTGDSRNVYALSDSTTVLKRINDIVHMTTCDHTQREFSSRVYRASHK